MEHINQGEDEDYEKGGKDRFFIEDLSVSEGEGGREEFYNREHCINKQVPRFSEESSPPLLLMFSSKVGASMQEYSTGPASTPDSQEEEEEDEEDSVQPIEDWMILGREEEEGDSSIQLNLSYWNSSEEDSGEEDQNVKPGEDIWAVSRRDMCGAEQSLLVRYFVPGRSLICSLCNKMGHLTKSCYYHKKCPTCVLCGVQGHVQRDCVERPCSSCGLPAHGSRPCERPPLWNQHCYRCGMTGHLSDVCPDTWRQYHLTVRLEAPLRPLTVHTLKYRKCFACCYNCSERGHYGYECTKRRMISGTSPSLPYVCHYDTMEDILKCPTRVQKSAKEPVNPGSLPRSDQQYSDGEVNHPLQGWSRTKQEMCYRAGRRKTWPERRRERREVKRQRREAQARREGGLLGRTWETFDNELCPTDPFKSPFHSPKQSIHPPKKTRRDKDSGRRVRKSKETEKWKKRARLKHVDLYHHGDTDTCSENLLSPKCRVRHRRK